MEFISNLIKRPISLVLNDTAAEQQQQQSTSSRKSQTPPPIAISNNKFDLANEKQQQQLLKQRNNCVVNNNSNNTQFAINSDKSLNCINNNFKESLRNNMMSTTDANNTAFVVDLGAGGDYEPRNNLLNSSNSNSSNSNSTASTIEELLVQINDNLNQAEIAQHVGDHAASDLLGATSTAHSQLATKSHSSNKLSQTPPRSQVQTPTTPTIFLASLPSPTYIAAGSAFSESTSKDNKLQTDADEESDSLQKNHLSNPKTGVNKINKFIGLTEFDESNIPELPGSLNPNIEEQLKLTFEDNFIPTLTASSIAVLAAASKKENNNKDGTPTKSLQLPVHNETDTAVSSDNELFTECQTFPYVNSAATASLFDTSDMGSEHISEAETFRSALNYNSTTVEEASNDHLNETMENVVDLPYEQNCAQPSQAWDDLIASIHEDFSPQNVSMQELATLDENEPMDVDMEVSSEYLQYNMNVTLTSDQINPSGKAKKTLETTLEEDESLKNSLTNNHSMLPLENSKEITVIESKIETEIEHKEEEPVNEVLEIAVEIKQSAEEEVSLLPAKSVDENKSSSVEDNVVLVEKEIKLNSVCENAIATSTAAYGDDNLKQNITPMTATLTLNNLVDEALSASERAVTNSQISSACNKDIKANLTLDTNSTCTVSEKKSPQFPLKQKPDNEHFPRSPDDDKQVVFLEKSEYSEKISSSSNTKRNILNIGLPFVAVPSSSQSNETINITDAKSSESEVHLMPNNNVNLSTDSTSQLNLMKSPANQHDTTFETNSLASSNVSPHLNETTNISDANSPVSQVHTMPCNTIDSSPATLPIPNTYKLNSTFGAATLPSSSSPQFNETIDITDANSPGSELPVFENLTIGMNSPAVHPSTSPLNNFDCTFDAKALPSPITTSQNTNSKEINALNLCQNAKTKKRYTYNVRETETQEKLNESSDAMDVDEEMQTAEDVPQSLPCSAELHHANTTFPAEMLSAKEKTTCNSTDEKDIFVENFVSPVLDDLFKAPSVPGVAQKQVASDGINNPFQQQQDYTANENFENDHKLFFNASDIDYLYTKGNNTVQTNDHRSSLLLKFDPLVGKPIQLSQPEKQELLLQKILAKNSTCVNSAIEENEEEPTVENQTASIDCCHKERGRKEINKSAESAKLNEEAAEEFFETQPELKNNARMSVDVIKDIQIENDCNKTIENSNTQLDEKQSKFNMDDLEKKIKNEVLKTEDIEKKLKEAEQREEALIKRITEKDKSIVKMNSVIEAYEKAIAELISEKEQLIQNYEKQLAEVKIDRDSNYHHLTSLETTFSDLHVKYEKSKEMTTQLKASEESLLAEKKQNLENLRLQEQRYEKMKNHAMQQLEIANRKLETLAKEHSIESTKLKALLKKEEISRASINEQLQQKSRENAELVKICDELINGQGS